jgi:hypothetical protein
MLPSFPNLFLIRCTISFGFDMTVLKQINSVAVCPVGINRLHITHGNQHVLWQACDANISAKTIKEKLFHVQQRYICTYHEQKAKVPPYKEGDKLNKLT